MIFTDGTWARGDVSRFSGPEMVTLWRLDREARGVRSRIWGRDRSKLLRFVKFSRGDRSITGSSLLVLLVSILKLLSFVSLDRQDKSTSDCRLILSSRDSNCVSPDRGSMDWKLPSSAGPFTALRTSRKAKRS